MMPHDPRRAALSISIDPEQAVEFGESIAVDAPRPARFDSAGRTRQTVLSTPIDVIDWERTLDLLMAWGARRESRAVAMCNAHSVVTARRDPEFGRVLADMDLATADGMSVAWLMRRLGRDGQQRVNGPDLMWRCCERAEQEGQSIYLFGNTPETLQRLVQCLGERFPALRIAGTHAPPFRALTEDEDRRVVADINGSGANLVFVSLGCPKQEHWIHEHSRRIAAVMIGVGAAFEFHSGIRPRAPQWMQDTGLEWFYRMICEPRRLTGRYFSTNLSFILGAAEQLRLDRRKGQPRRLQ
jgi:N-acetylglucosaminyldiphosphoundecaprenol N-acetyl-beta-D-mannosaminyltransferase